MDGTSVRSRVFGILFYNTALSLTCLMLSLVFIMLVVYQCSPINLKRLQQTDVFTLRFRYNQVDSIHSLGDS